MMQCSHEEETQWNECLVNAAATAGCGDLTAAEIAMKCGSPINSNSSICPVRLYALLCLHANADMSWYRNDHDVLRYCEHPGTKRRRTHHSAQGQCNEWLELTLSNLAHSALRTTFPALRRAESTQVRSDSHLNGRLCICWATVCMLDDSQPQTAPLHSPKSACLLLPCVTLVLACRCDRCELSRRRLRVQQRLQHHHQCGQLGTPCILESRDTCKLVYLP